jgi:hypothetical protein
MADIFERPRRTPAAAATPDGSSQHHSSGPSKKRGQRGVKMSLDQLLATPAAALPRATTAAAAASTRNSQGRFTDATSSSPTLHSTSLSLVLHFLPLSSFLVVSRCCRAWRTVAASRLAWSGSGARVTVKGSIEERRMRGGSSDPASRVRNFNPLHMHETTSSAAAASSRQEAESSRIVVDRRITHPLEFLVQSCPLAKHLRHLIYIFASPAIRTKLADRWSSDMFSTDVVCSEFPFAALPVDAFNFLSSLSLRNVTLCSQLSLQSAFQRLGVQTHSYLRALEIEVSEVLDEREKARTLTSILTEVGSQMSSLEILSFSQRNLPSDIPLEPLLSLKHLHTLVLHSSFDKTHARIQVIRALSLHGQLAHLSWPLWNSVHMKRLFGGIRRKQEVEEEMERDWAEGVKGSGAAASEMSSALDSMVEEFTSAISEISGLDDEENAANVGTMVTHTNSSTEGDVGFRFREWTVDKYVSCSNLRLYFAATPTLLPQLRTLLFDQTAHFDSFAEHLKEILEALPELTALGIRVSLYSLGPSFWSSLTSCTLARLSSLHLDQLHLVVLQKTVHAQGAVFEINPVEQARPRWEAFSGLRELTMMHMTLPSLVGLASAASRLESLHLQTVSFAPQCHTEHGTSLRELATELQGMAHLDRFLVEHCPDVTESSTFADLLRSVPPSAPLSCVGFCALVEGSLHRDTHVACLREWQPASVRFFDVGHDSHAAGGAAPSAIDSDRNPLLRRQPSVSREEQVLIALHRDVHLARRARARQAPAHSSGEAAAPVGMRLAYWAIDGRQRTLPAERI